MNHAQKLVLDSWAVMAYLEDQPAAEKIADMIADAGEKGVSLLMSVVNIGEVWYATARKHSDRDADRAIHGLRSIGVKFVDVDWPTTQIAARYKAFGGIAYADCFAAALAKQNNAPLLTGDPEFKQLDDEISIVWLS